MRAMNNTVRMPRFAVVVRMPAKQEKRSIFPHSLSKLAEIIALAKDGSRCLPGFQNGTRFFAAPVLRTAAFQSRLGLNYCNRASSFPPLAPRFSTGLFLPRAGKYGRFFGLSSQS